MTTDIRSTEIKIKVKKSESATDAIRRDMQRKGFTFTEWQDGKGLKHQAYLGNGYSELWVSGYNFSYITNKVTFVLDGNR